MEKDKGKIIFELGLMDSRAREFEQQIMIIDGQLQELRLIQEDLEKLSKNGKKEVLMPLSSDILVKGNITDSENVLVNVGAGVVLKKNINEAKDITEKHEKKISEVKEKLLDEINRIVDYMLKLESDLRQK
jgi:prefoldin alpha subunit